MRLTTPGSAILSAVIFNALIIIALIPLALKGARYRPLGAAAVLRRNLWVYGVGGILIPFPGIKLVDMILVALGLAEGRRSHHACPPATGQRDSPPDDPHHRCRPSPPPHRP